MLFKPWSLPMRAFIDSVPPVRVPPSIFSTTRRWGWRGYKKDVWPIHPSEVSRQKKLDSLQIIDTEPERAFDDITRLAAKVFETPIALVSIVDHGRQWFKSRVGFPEPETCRDVSFCAYVILPTSPDVFVVLDTHLDDRFCNSPLVLGEPHIRCVHPDSSESRSHFPSRRVTACLSYRFYIGAPLIYRGERLGSFCCISPQPRSEVSDHAREVLKMVRQLISLPRQILVANDIASPVQMADMVVARMIARRAASQDAEKDSRRTSSPVSSQKSSSKRRTASSKRFSSLRNTNGSDDHSPSSSPPILQLSKPCTTSPDEVEVEVASHPQPGSPRKTHSNVSASNDTSLQALEQTYTPKQVEV